MTKPIMFLLVASLLCLSAHCMDTNKQVYDCDTAYSVMYNNFAETIETGNVKEFKIHLNLLAYCAFKDRKRLTMNSSSGATALHYCITHAFIEGIKTLCENCHSTIIEMTDKAGYTPLMWAIHNNKPDIVQLLLNYRCNPIPIYNPNDKILAASMQQCPAALPMLAAASTVSLADLPEDLLLKIWTYWCHERTQFLFPGETEEAFLRLTNDLFYVSKTWNSLWDKKKIDLIAGAMLKVQEKEV
jgi:ankyrin repeat protein